MEKSKLKDILLYQEKIEKSKIILRELSAVIEKEKNNPFITIVSGIRRSGKSTLLLSIKENAYYVNFDDERFLDFTVKDFSLLEEILLELFGKRDFFIFDEIQNITGWERFARRLHDVGEKIFITGSNASMLSKELGTHLTGRTVSYCLYPFSFKEYLNSDYDLNKLSLEKRSKIKKEFNNFLIEGGFPEYIKTKNKEYLKSLYENILYRDIIVRYKLPSQVSIKKVAEYGISNIGKQMSFNSIKKLVNFSSATTIREYFEYFESSFLIFTINKFDYSLKKQLINPKKVYCIDNGLAKTVGFHFSENTGRLLENLVFIQLKRNNEEIYYHKNKHECDFVIKEGLKITKAIQVTQELNIENKEREIKGLLEALNQYNLKEGLILTNDQEDEIKEQNKLIKIKPIWKWLLEN